MTSTLQLQMHLMLQEKKGERERKKEQSRVLWSCDLKNTNKQAYKQMVSLKHVARSHKSTYLLCFL